MWHWWISSISLINNVIQRSEVSYIKAISKIISYNHHLEKYIIDKSSLWGKRDLTQKYINGHETKVHEDDKSHSPSYRPSRNAIKKKASLTPATRKYEKFKEVLATSYSRNFSFQHWWTFFVLYITILLLLFSQ